MTAPTPSSPDPDHSRRSSRPYQGHGGRHGGGQPGSHRRGDPGGGDHSAGPYGAAGGGEPYGRYGASGEGRQAHGGYGYPGGHAAREPYGHDASYDERAYHDASYHEGPYQGGPMDPDALGALDGERADVRREFRAGAVWALVVLVFGVGLGFLWLWLAPRVPLVSVDGGVFLKDPEGEEAIGADGTFVLLALGLGVVTGLIAFLRSRGGGIGIVVGVAVGALLGSVLAWRLGVWLGPDSDLAASAKAAGENKPFDGPLKLQAKGVLLVWPFIALTTHLALTGIFGHRDPEPTVSLPQNGGGAQHW